MDNLLNRPQLVDEMAALNEEAEYHADRANKLEQQRDALLDLVRGWWGAVYTTDYCKSLQARSEQLLIEIGRANV